MNKHLCEITGDQLSVDITEIFIDIDAALSHTSTKNVLVGNPNGKDEIDFLVFEVVRQNGQVLFREWR